MIWFLLACGDESDLKEDSATEITFENEDVVSLGEESTIGFYQLKMDHMSGFLLPFDAPASTYEIAEVTIDVYTGADNCTSSVNVFAIATEDPMAISELTGFFAYDGLAPFTFPDLPDSRSGVLELTSESNPSASPLGQSDGYEFTLTFDSPLLVEDNVPFWLGVGLHAGGRTCLNAVDISTQVSYAFSGGEAFSFDDSDGVIKMRAKVRY